MWNKDEIQGKHNEIEGAVNAKVGKFIHDPNLEAEGKAERLAGQAQQKVGKLRRKAGKVDVNNNAVTLRGRVETAAQKTEAERVAKNTEGVKSVSNQLKVGGAPVKKS